jgi:hypothetical protein
MAVITLSQALDRATAGEPIAPNATLAASMSLATNTLARQAALREAKRGSYDFEVASRHSPCRRAMLLGKRLELLRPHRFGTCT